MHAKAQSSKFDSLWDGLTFNIYSGKPDSVVLPFIKNHFPYLAKRPKPGGWTMYPPGPVIIPGHGMHSLRVVKHPFINTEHGGARLDLLTQEWKEGPPSIEHTRVWIYFQNKPQLKKARKQLVHECEDIGLYVEHANKNKLEKLVIRENKEEDIWRYFSIIMNKSQTANHYSMLVLWYDDKGEPW